MTITFIIFVQRMNILTKISPIRIKVLYFSIYVFAIENINRFWNWLYKWNIINICITCVAFYETGAVKVTERYVIFFVCLREKLCFLIQSMTPRVKICLFFFYKRARLVSNLMLNMSSLNLYLTTGGKLWVKLHRDS